MAAGATRVRHEAVVLHSQRRIGLDHFATGVLGIGERRCHAFEPVTLGPGAERAREDFHEHERLAVRVVTADADDAVPPSPAAGTRRARRRERAEHGIEHAIAGQRARRAGAGHHRLSTDASGAPSR